MFKNYFKTAFRNLWQNKTFSVINVLGLAIGISASLVIYLLVNYHFSFDKFEKDHDRIYRIVSDFNFSGTDYHNSGVHDPMAAAVKREVTGLDIVAPFRKWGGDAKVGVKQEGKKDLTIFKHEGNFVFADSNYFNLINYDWVAGSAGTSLRQPYQTVLTVSNARRYFPGLAMPEIVGKELYVNDSIRLTITGIVNDLQHSSDFTFKNFIAYSTLEYTSLKPENWDNWGSTTGDQQLYVKLSKGTAPEKINAQLAAIYKRHNTPDPDDHSTTTHLLQPLSDVHFNSNYGAYGLPVANKPTLYGLLAIAAFLLILGCINFINLTTAQSSQRAKEIGIRKTMGGTKNQLIIQFLSETFLLTLMAMLLSVLLAPILLKAFSGFIPDNLHFNVTKDPGIIVFLIVLTIVVTFAAGFYPALILSGFKPVLVLKNQAFARTSQTRKVWLRRSLTVSQLVIAQVFIMATILVSRQIHYSLNKNMGFKKDAILILNTNYNDTVPGHKYLLLNKLRAIPGVALVSLCTNPPSSSSTWSGTVKYNDGKHETESDVQMKYGDSNYIRLYQISLLAGKNIETSDTVRAALINETYAHILGFRNVNDAIGKTLKWSEKNVEIAGVIGDFNQQSFHEPIKPLIIGSWGKSENTISVALQSQSTENSSWKNTIENIGKAWKQVYPGDDFNYHFLDEDIAKYYTAEQNISTLLKWATALAVFISCLGLLGLTIYTTTQRTKEIGVRKVLGASVSQIVSLISKDFILLILTAFAIAVPLAWIGMNKWLENFAFRTEVSWWIFGASGLLMILISLITLSFQTIKAAMANPVKSLRTE